MKTIEHIEGHCLKKNYKQPIWCWIFWANFIYSTAAGDLAMLGTMILTVQYKVTYLPLGKLAMICAIAVLLRLRQNGCHFADDIFKCIFLNEKFRISNSISLNYVPYDLIDSISSLVQIMAWRRIGGKPLSEPMMVNLLTHMCHRPQWVKKLSSMWIYFYVSWNKFKCIVCSANHTEIYA